MQYFLYILQMYSIISICYNSLPSEEIKAQYLRTNKANMQLIIGFTVHTEKIASVKTHKKR